MFDTLLINPILNVLVALYRILDVLQIPGALGLSIVLLTILIRLILWPLTTTQLKSSQKMAALKPHMDRLKAEHGHDKIRHQQEITKLYQQHGVNPVSGCLPLLLQIPVFIALYNVLLKIVDFGKADFLNAINSRLYSSSLNLTAVPDTSFVGFDLAAKPNQWSQIGVLILLVPVVTGVLQFIQSKMLAPQSPVHNQPPKPKENANKQDLQDSMAQVQSQMVLIMPAMIAFFSYGFPFGLSLYWNTFTIIGIIQQYVVAGPGSLAKYLPEKWRK